MRTLLRDDTDKAVAMRRAVIALSLLLALACEKRPAAPQAAEHSRDVPSKSVSGFSESHQDVQLIEYRIAMPDSLPAGKHAFSVVNAGEQKHGLVIEGNGVHLGTPELAKGGSAALDVDLKPGTYEVYCPVDGHKDKGMKRTLVVK